MSVEKILKCAVVGVGYLGEHHARFYHELPHCELVGVFDTDNARAQEIANRHECKVFGSLEEIGQECEAASIVVPTNFHKEVAVPLLEAGCHLLVEKPICNSLREAEAILDAANKGNCIVQVGHVEHYNPVMHYLETKVAAPRYIMADRLAPFNPERGIEVGVVLDLMIHDIGIILQLVRSEVTDIRSVGVSVMTGREDIANARIEFANGCVANLNASRVSQKKVREIRIFQENQYLSLDFMHQAGHIMQRVPEGLLREEIPIEKGEPLKLELASFAHTVRTQGTPKVCGNFGFQALKTAILITEQIRESWANNLAQAIPEKKFTER
jgi:predicted dehydrogenase